MTRTRRHLIVLLLSAAVLTTAPAPAAAAPPVNADLLFVVRYFHADQFNTGVSQDRHSDPRARCWRL